ncbi:kinase-like protein [Aspergillus ellipticus CBS 707.79]|uniref:Kinase-like protein n=1 Tax=Aspergillus ellipticus CBS 707.79 TaxID=1448320 RepID=A0A319DQH3_9EURO|nr:kinase-like protein [Aspergillus ellipticus CBS 707.79]
MSDETIVLPSIAEIEASTVLLSDPCRSVKAVRVRERFVVKVGASIAPLEAENMKFVASNSKVRVPKVHDEFVDPETRKRYIIMDYVPGTDLEKLAPFLSEDQKKTVSKRVREALDELRRIPSPGYFGNLNHTPYYEGILSTLDRDPSISGPFENEEQFNQGILKSLGQRESPHYVRLLGEAIQRTLRGHKTVFTHADLQPKNVMVEQNGVCEDGSPDYQITLIDWSLAGWYPEYWDYCNSTVYCQGKPEWLELVPDIFDEYPVEYLMMRTYYTSMFY